MNHILVLRCHIQRTESRAVLSLEDLSDLVGILLFWCYLFYNDLALLTDCAQDSQKITVIIELTIEILSYTLLLPPSSISAANISS